MHLCELQQLSRSAKLSRDSYNTDGMFQEGTELPSCQSNGLFVTVFSNFLHSKPKPERTNQCNSVVDQLSSKQ